MREPGEIFTAVALPMTGKAKQIVEQQRDECVSHKLYELNVKADPWEYGSQSGA
jgi:hypothetical protein